MNQAYQRAMSVVKKRYPPQARSDKVGRNEPCPCGSGKKYKRCCANKPTTNGVTPRPTLDMVLPQFGNGDQLHEDLAIIRQFMFFEPILASIRYERAVVVEFLKDPANAAWYDPDLRGEDRDDLAMRFVARQGDQQEPLVDRALQAFAALVENHIDDPAAVRALLRMCGLLDVWKKGTRHEGFFNPVLVTIFYHSMEQLHDEALNDVLTLAERGATGRGERIDRDELSALAGKLSLEPLAKEFFARRSAKLQDELEQALDEGTFPVPLPGITQLPLVVRLEDIFAEQGNVERGQVAAALIAWRDEDLHDEDTALYQEFLASRRDELDGEGTKLVTKMLAQLTVHGLAPYAPRLYRCGRRSDLIELDGWNDAELLNPDHTPNADAAAKLADFYEGRGYSALASRTRALFPSP